MNRKLAENILSRYSLLKEGDISSVRETIDIPKYVIFEVSDYHEFRSIQYNFLQIGLEYEYKEIPGTGFVAIFYMGDLPKDLLESLITLYNDDRSVDEYREDIIKSIIE